MERMQRDVGEQVSATRSQEVTEVIKVDKITSQGLAAVFKKKISWEIL